MKVKTPPAIDVNICDDSGQIKDDKPAVVTELIPLKPVVPTPFGISVVEEE